MTGIPKPVSLLLRVLLTAIVVGFVVFKLRQERFNLDEIFSVSDSRAVLAILAALILLPANLGLEAMKWKILVRPFYPEVDNRLAVKAVLAGMASGIFTPNRVGEYAGRLFWLPEGRRLEALVVTFFDRIGQMFITLVAGLTSFMIFLGHYKNQLVSEIFGSESWLILFSVLAVLLLLVVIGVLIFPEISLGWMVSRINRPWAVRIKTGLHNFDRKRMQTVLVLSFVRYLVFTFQYYLLLCAFSYNGSFTLAAGMISLVFLGKSLFPVLGFAELGVREWVAIEVMGIFGLSALQAFNSTFLLYLINILLPAALGAVFIMGMKFSANKPNNGKAGEEPQ